MEKLVIVVGDTTSHGGSVLTGDLDFTISDKPVARFDDKVLCPIHGETTIIEGYQTITLQPSRHLAYDGCKTSCGAVLIGGQQQICFIDFDDGPVATTSSSATHPTQSTAVKVEPSHSKTAKTKTKKSSKPRPELADHGAYPNEDEFKLFVATIWGEACNQSTNGWKAVGSVIMNRVDKFRWSHRKSVTRIIYDTGFDAVKSKRNKEFPKAWSYLFENKKDALTAFETMRMKKLIEVVRPIYYHKEVITNANYYYSPNAQNTLHKKEQKNHEAVKVEGKHPARPSFLKDPLVKEVYVELLLTDDLKFFYGPHHKK